MEIKQGLQKQACSCPSRPSRSGFLMLPIAPGAVARNRFTSSEHKERVISPADAMTWIQEHYNQGTDIKGVNIEGPGDPLAEIGPTRETLRLLQQKHPELPIGLTTMGIHGAAYAGELTDSGVTYVTILVDAVNAETAAKLYAWIRPGRKTVPLAKAADLLISEQEKAVKTFIQAGCYVTMMTTVFPGYNDDQIVDIAKTFSGFGTQEMCLAPFLDDQDIMPFQPDNMFMNSLAERAGQHMKVYIVPRKEVLALGMDCAFPSALCTTNALLPGPNRGRPNVAVASLNGMEVDLHIGQAWQFLIYGPREDGLVCLIEKRPAPEPGGGDTRWQTLAESLGDCFALLASAAGEKPKKILADHGITVLITEDNIEGTVDMLLGGGKKKKA